MFSKPTNKTPPKPAAAPEPPPLTATDAARPKPKVASLISSGITIEGGVAGDGELQIDGTVRGDVRVGRLTVGETGHIEGSVYAEAAEIRGRVVGSVTAKQVRLYGTSYIDGDITHEQLAMETGAFFQGRSLKFQRPAAPTPAPQAAPVANPNPTSTPQS
ncbi:cytoskeletal protein CcmA (bactofilin family) [Caulobacter ginsengisoli]|uniref:Cytoskeletal protein CcmA (Bactofilin family) n=1 Tax=Caulobacter ginsengisoli TaxID=400775 RepID=A0ABU0ILI7_9CAUL|nr:polymer-forming cytoskeletal protein [Caulobacter ginsengisoli]MDQ0462876.1 cytoskeletal protein CcmA (bactofilin family) [Caulobacter ginsengisoli]